MASVVELNISDEKHAALTKLASQRGISLKDLCDKIIINCLCRYRKETEPIPDIDLKTLIKNDQEFFAELYSESLKSERIEIAEKHGNLIKLAKTN